jgi:hypothetical protein
MAMFSGAAYVPSGVLIKDYAYEALPISLMDDRVKPSL